MRCQRCASEIFSNHCELCNAVTALRALVRAFARTGYRARRLGLTGELQGARNVLSSYDRRYPEILEVSDAEAK